MFVGDCDREYFINFLRNAFVQGYLDQDSWADRNLTVLKAKYRSELLRAVNGIPNRAELQARQFKPETFAVDEPKAWVFSFFSFLLIMCLFIALIATGVI
jgi:hypothetical protein